MNPLEKLDRPYRDRLIEIKREFLRRAPGPSPYCKNWITSTLCRKLDSVIDKSGRDQFLSWLCDRPVNTSKYGVEGGLTEWEGFKLCVWAGINTEAKPNSFGPNFGRDCTILVFAFPPQKEEIPFDPEAEKYKTFFQDMKK